MQAFSDFRYSVIKFTANSLSFVSSMLQLDPLYWISLSLSLINKQSSVSHNIGTNLSCSVPIPKPTNIVKDIFSLTKEEKAFISILLAKLFIALGLICELDKEENTSTFLL